MKELIIQSLETKGVLGQIRAQLRSSVFKVVDEQDQQFNTGCGLKWENKALYNILNTKIGSLLAEIIREFMEYYRMDYSLSIFIPECGISPERLNRNEILGKLGILNNSGDDKIMSSLKLPFIYYIIHYFINELKQNPKKVIDSIKQTQNDLEKKADELINDNLVKYVKNLKNEEEGNKDANVNKKDEKNQEQNKKQNAKEKEKEKGKQDEDNVEEINKEKEKQDDDDIEEINNEEEKKEIESNPKTNNNTGEKKAEVSKNPQLKRDPQSNEEIPEDIFIDGVDELEKNNQSSKDYNNSQTVSASQGYDNTAEAGSLDNYDYEEIINKPEDKK